jgi:hypothetical protein
MIEQLRPLPVEEVGSAKYLMQHDWIEKLNLQAHCNAQAHSDEFVMEYLVSYDKVTTLVHDLLVIEVSSPPRLGRQQGAGQCASAPA